MALQVMGRTGPRMRVPPVDPMTRLVNRMRRAEPPKPRTEPGKPTSSRPRQPYSVVDVLHKADFNVDRLIRLIGAGASFHGLAVEWENRLFRFEPKGARIFVLLVTAPDAVEATVDLDEKDIPSEAQVHDR